MRRFLLITVVASAAGCAWWNSPERQIRRVLEEVAERLSHEAPVPPLAAAAAAARLQEYLAPEVTIDPGRPFEPLSGRDAALGAAARVIAGTLALGVEFVDVRVDFHPGSGAPDRADVSCSVTTTVEAGGAQPSRDAGELKLIMRSIAGRWTIEQVKAVSPLEPVP